METITKKIIKLIEEKEGLLPDEIKEHLIELKEEIKKRPMNHLNLCYQNEKNNNTTHPICFSGL